jgi:hypothetical protein
MSLAVRIAVPCVVALLALLAMVAPASAAPQRISGKLSKPGYTVIALARSGEASVVAARSGAFRLRPPTRRVTLHLRTPRGRYAGPIVLGSRKAGRRAVVELRAGGRLGRIVVRARRGYARAKREPDGAVDGPPLPRAKRGVPIGAGRFGRVQSRPSGGRAPGDADLDGVPDPLDVDDDGDLLLDELDRVDALGAFRVRASQAPGGLRFHTSLGGGLHQTANANAPGFTTEWMNDALSEFGALGIDILPGNAAELDCGGSIQDPPHPTGLTYCSLGGTGRVFTPGLSYSDSPRFPDDADADGDGFGTLEPSPDPSVAALVLSHGATTAAIGTGDVLVEHVATDVPESQCPAPAGTSTGSCASFPATVNYVFSTVPALVSYSDETGPPQTVSYPVDPGGPGTVGNGFPVDDSPDDADGDVELTLTFWRPQRRPITPETAEWVDIGGLNYTASGQGGVGGACPQRAFSENDPNLTAPTDDPTPEPRGFRDLAVDQPANPANTFTYTLNLTQCLAASGLTFEAGEERGISFHGVNPGGSDDALQSVHFVRR